MAQTFAPAPQQATPQLDCQGEFNKLKQDAETHAKPLQAAAKRKAQPAELCPMFKRFADAEAKVVRFFEKHQTSCQIPAEAVQQAKQNHARTVDYRTKVCNAAAAGTAAPATPSAGLSGALGTVPLGGAPAPAPGSSGIFDTLTGNVLQR